MYVCVCQLIHIAAVVQRCCMVVVNYRFLLCCLQCCVCVLYVFFFPGIFVSRMPHPSSIQATVPQMSLLNCRWSMWLAYLRIPLTSVATHDKQTQEISVTLQKGVEIDEHLQPSAVTKHHVVADLYMLKNKIFRICCAADTEHQAYFMMLNRIPQLWSQVKWSKEVLAADASAHQANHSYLNGFLWT